MTGLKIIPIFFLLMVLTYMGIQFVEANRDEVVVTVGNWQSSPTSLGFVVITSCFCGMVFSAAISLAELLRLYVQNHRLKRKIKSIQSSQSPESSIPTDIVPPKTSGRFT
jgi:hypothetical protein